MPGITITLDHDWLLQLIDERIAEHDARRRAEADGRHYSAKQFAEAVGITHQYVQTLVGKKKLPRRQCVPGGHLHFLQVDVDRYRAGDTSLGALESGYQSNGGAAHHTLPARQQEDKS